MEEDYDWVWRPLDLPVDYLDYFGESPFSLGNEQVEENSSSLPSQQSKSDPVVANLIADVPSNASDFCSWFARELYSIGTKPTNTIDKDHEDPHNLLALKVLLKLREDKDLLLQVGSISYPPNEEIVHNCWRVFTKSRTPGNKEVSITKNLVHCHFGRLGKTIGRSRGRKMKNASFLVPNRFEIIDGKSEGKEDILRLIIFLPSRRSNDERPPSIRKRKRKEGESSLGPDLKVRPSVQLLVIVKLAEMFVSA